MADLFKEIIPAIMQTKNNCIVSETDEKSYVPFIVNKALSFHFDCIMRANEMNLRPGLDKKLQFQYLSKSIRGYKRQYQKWYKKEKEENLEMIKEFYGYSTGKAKTALALLSEEQLEIIRKKLDRGGLSK